MKTVPTSMGTSEGSMKGTVGVDGEKGVMKKVLTRLDVFGFQLLINSACLSLSSVKWSEGDLPLTHRGLPPPNVQKSSPASDRETT